MKRIKIIILALVLGFVSTSFAQKNKEERKSKRIAFVTKLLELTPEESKVFWPIYEQKITDKKEKIKPYKRAKRKERKKLEAMTDDEVLQLMDNVLTIRQIELDLEKEYLTKFLTVLPPKKVAKLYHIEKRFKQRKNKNKGKNKKR